MEASSADAVVAALVQAAVAEDDSALHRAREQLYAAALNTRFTTLRLIAERLVQRKITQSTVRPQIRWMLEEARHGEPLILAIYLMNAGRHVTLPDHLTTLARHPRLWRMATRLLDRLGVETLDLKWAWLAWTHGGYPDGRGDTLIDQLVPQLEARRDIRAWILRVDCADAVVRATAGDLAGALEDVSIDDEVLTGICQLIEQLAPPPNARPYQSMETYAEGVLVVDRLVGHLLDRCHTVRRLHTVQSILTWLEWSTDILLPPNRQPNPADDIAARWARREALGWTEDVRASLADDCARILRRARSRQLVQDAFDGTNIPEQQQEMMRRLAWPLASSVGLDLWDAGYQRLVQNPFDSELSGWLLATDDSARAEKVIQLIAGLLPRATRTGTFRQSPDVDKRVHLTTATRLVSAMRRLQLYNERIVAFALAQNECTVRDNVTPLLENRPVEQWGDEVADALHIAQAVERCEHTRIDLELLRARLDASTAG